MTNIHSHTQSFRDLAAREGFSYCGFAQAGFLEDEAKGLDDWLKMNLHGEMKWMENHLDKRLDPRILEPGTKSVVVLMQNYFPGKDIGTDPDVRISKYALGRDYHKVLKAKMKRIIESSREEIGDFQARAFVDSAPVMERAWARKAGLGWQGKNSLTLVKRGGSFFFLGVILTDLEFVYDKPSSTNYCGSCSLCIEACPTAAIIQPGVVDARRCISYLSIELKDSIPEEFRSRMESWVFGCDTCQDVCPHNKRYSLVHEEKDFGPRESIMKMSKEEWDRLEELSFDQIFQGSAVKRAGYIKLMKNIKIQTGNKYL